MISGSKRLRFDPEIMGRRWPSHDQQGGDEQVA
jgi:hypothetical protein